MPSDRPGQQIVASAPEVARIASSRSEWSFRPGVLRLAGLPGHQSRLGRRGSDQHQLADAIRSVTAGETLISPAITRRLIEEFCRAPSRSRENGPPAEVASLTARELEVLECIVRGFSNSEISMRLFVAETTVKTHVARVLTKLGVRDRVHAVIVAYESGLIRAGERDSPG